MLNPLYSSNKRSHYPAIIFALLLSVLIVAAFISFGLGAYFVYDRPISDVVATTTHNGSQTFLSINASGLNGNSVRTVWVDPQITYDANGGAIINTSSGYKIGNATSNGQGDLSTTLQITQSSLEQISSDGQSVHSIWIVGISQSQTGSQFVSLSSDSEHNYTSSSMGSGITLFVTLLTFVVPLKFSLGGLFLGLWTVYLILFAIALNGPFKSVFGAVRATEKKGFSALFQNSMYTTMIVFPVVLWATILLELLQQAGGVSTGSLPSQDPLLQLVELTIAPLREEFGFRVIPIGFAVFGVLMTRGRVKDSIMALWHPSKYLKKNDTPQQYKKNLILVYLMIAISSSLFGLAHYVLGSGWGPGKIIEAAVAGVALGALYYEYGFPAAVLLHWLIDYFLTIYTLTPRLTSIGNLITLYTILIAVISSAVLIYLLIGKFRKTPVTVYQENMVPTIS